MDVNVVVGIVSVSVLVLVLFAQFKCCAYKILFILSFSSPCVFALGMLGMARMCENAEKQRH